MGVTSLYKRLKLVSILSASLVALTACSPQLPSYTSMDEVVNALRSGGVTCLEPIQVYDDYNKNNSVSCYVETYPGNLDSYRINIFDDEASLNENYKGDCADLSEYSEKDYIRGVNWSINPGGWMGSKDIPLDDFHKALGGEIVSRSDLAGCKQ
jgi:hypothetical protein